MEAKKTVMGIPEIDARMCNYASNFSSEDMKQIHRVAQAQAEISFKAGEENERAKHDLHYCEMHNLYYCDCCPDCFKAMGIREVVEWINTHNNDMNLPLEEGVEFHMYLPEEWQAKLKEWGINKGD